MQQPKVVIWMEGQQLSVKVSGINEVAAISLIEMGKQTLLNKFLGKTERTADVHGAVESALRESAVFARRADQ